MTADEALGETAHVYLDSNFLIYLFEGKGPVLGAVLRLWEEIEIRGISVSLSAIGVAERLIGAYRSDDRVLLEAYQTNLIDLGLIDIVPVGLDLLVCAASLGCVDKLASQIGGILIQGSFGRSCRDPWIDERSGMVLS